MSICGVGQSNKGQPHPNLLAELSVLLLELGQDRSKPELEHLDQSTVLLQLRIELGLRRFPRCARRRFGQDLKHTLPPRHGVRKVGRRFADVRDRLLEESLALLMVRTAKKHAVAFDETEPRSQVRWQILERTIDDSKQQDRVRGV